MFSYSVKKKQPTVIIDDLEHVSDKDLKDISIDDIRSYLYQKVGKISGDQLKHITAPRPSFE